MSIDLVVKYRDPIRTDGYFPFAFQRYARLYWWPFAERLGLGRLQQLELLRVDTRADAEGLVEEILAVEAHVEALPAEAIPSDHRAYLLERVEKVVPFLRDVIVAWDEVDHLYM